MPWFHRRRIHLQRIMHASSSTAVAQEAPTAVEFAHGTISGALLDGAESQEELRVIQSCFLSGVASRNFARRHHNTDEETIDLTLDRTEELADKCAHSHSLVVHNACRERVLIRISDVRSWTTCQKSRLSFSVWTYPKVAATTAGSHDTAPGRASPVREHVCYSDE